MATFVQWATWDDVWGGTDVFVDYSSIVQESPAYTQFQNWLSVFRHTYAQDVPGGSDTAVCTDLLGFCNFNNDLSLESVARIVAVRGFCPLACGCAGPLFGAAVIEGGDNLLCAQYDVNAMPTVS